MTTQAKQDVVKWGALIVAILIQFAVALIWAGRIDARVSEVESKAADISAIKQDVAVIKAIVERLENNGRRK